MASMTPASAMEPIYRVDLNKTQILRLPSPAGSVVIGDTKIADVTVHSPTTVLVVGRGYGETNLVIMDREGRTIVDADIQVTSTMSTHGVRLFNASSRQTYSCAPYCQPSPVLGDNPQFISQFGVKSSAVSSPNSILDSVASNVASAGAIAGGNSPTDAESPR